MTKHEIKQCLDSLKNVFTAMTFFSCNALKWVLMRIQECKVRSATINIDSDKLLFYPFSIAINKCNGSGNPYAKLCFPNFVKDMNIKVFNLILRINETIHASWHETCACK